LKELIKIIIQILKIKKKGKVIHADFIIDIIISAGDYVFKENNIFL